ncbi:MAG: Tm-1-like ATP-binding domain-containing protein [Pseudomonadota bacterium]
MTDRTILLIGTYDTKNAELEFVAQTIRDQGGTVQSMDVSVLGDPERSTDISKHDVAKAAGSSIAEAIASEDENTAMQIMARGAAQLAAKAQMGGHIHGVLVLGGTMGTDVALDVCAALPLGVPKYIVSTVSFSALIPPDRLAADVQMILWAGGLYGLNDICKASLSQAAGAVLGAARAVKNPTNKRPVIGMTSFGKTVLRYMVPLKPALEARGFDVAVFHATGMGGRAFESLAAQGAFAAVMDFAPQEVSNHLMGSTLSAGAARMTAAGLAGIPQLVSFGCYDLVDFVGWQDPPPALAGQELHAHNRLLSSVLLNADQRRSVARTICEKLATAQGPVTALLPLQGCNEWDRPEGPLHDADGLAAFIDEMRAYCPTTVEMVEINGHINDEVFAQNALRCLDAWIASGMIDVNTTG